MQTNYSIMKQFGTSAFNIVLHWHKLGEVENEYTSEKFILFVIFVPKISQLVDIWQSSDKNNFA